jgi:Putative Flp pilus-assembly TadE/G-like
MGSRGQQGGGPRGGSAEHGHEGGRPPSQKGQAIVLIALMMAVLVGFVALAVDSARAFDGRRVLQDSVDAAALAAAESYQNGVNWTAAQTNALQLFERDNRLYSGHACVPSSFLVPNPGSPGTPVVTTCMMSGGSGYVLTLSVADSGPAGQTFNLSATRPLTVALMQVLGQSPVITLTASSTATANDQATTPALAGLSQAGCFGSGGTTPFSVVTSTTPFPTVIGDVVSNGAASLDASSNLQLGGDLLTRCAAPTNAANFSYECWPGVATWPPYGTPPCSGAYVQGSLRSTSNNFADPGYAAPPTTGLVSQGAPGTNVTLSSGIYATDPQFGSGGAFCYFLRSGVYEWQAGLTVNAGLISNELKPPKEPGPNPPFWRLSGGNTCEGDWLPASATAAHNDGVTSGNWPVVVTSVRTSVYNGQSYTRESAPSACALVNVTGTDAALAINISNVPGATSYNVYAARPPATCASQLGMVGSIANGVTEKNISLNTCPAPNGGTCGLGAVGAVNGVFFDVNSISGSWAPNGAAAPDTSRAYPPDSEASDFQGGTTFPAVNHARATYPSGDRANENLCALTTGAETSCPAAVTPGAVVMYLTNGSCLNLTSGGDAHLYSGSQYNWVLDYEPPATTCANTWQGRFNSAPIGMSYTPGASFRFAGGNASQTRSFGGVVAGSILLQSATGLALIFNSAYAPRPPGTRLTG